MSPAAYAGEGGDTPPSRAGRSGSWLRRHGKGVGIVLGLLLVLSGALVLLDRFCPLNLARLASPGTEILDRDGRSLAILPAPGGVWRLRTTPDDVAPVLLDILIATEDRRFWQHPGVDPLALARAAWQDLRAGRILSGGSTLTMQAARLLEPRPRTLRSKLIEIARALQLEAHFSKREILGIWLTLAPMGGNLEGVRAGSLAWFGTGPRLLAPPQAALLVAIPRRPEALRPDRHPDRARALRDRILPAAAGAEIPRARTPLPRHARQAIARLPAAPQVATTLDLSLQVALERLAAERLQFLPERASLALLVADARRREIRALASGGDGRGEGRGGALDLTRAVRSPGSALKPFIYAMAFQDGVAGPDTVLADLPRRFGSYAPENFDHGFAGTLTAAEALRRSLNLPAVALLDRVGPLRFAATLRTAGIALHLPAGADPALPLALGGVGITLRDLAGLYAALATDGGTARLRLLADDPPEPRPFLAPRAAATIAAVLTQPLPEGGPAGIAWKTGTSWGGRDAWAIGFDRGHVVGVWIGRPDGTPLPGATGRSLAVPLLGRVFDLLPPAPRDPPPPVVPRPTVSPQADALRLLFPPNEAVLSADGPVTLRAMGGRRPLTFLVDGTPLRVDPARREAAWIPGGPGFYRITVLDAEGTSARAAVRVR
ncbi:Multimodular transpeptidase-transglycosylase [Rhodovastum atsumiense]|uniref:peptidoglycan glycosyltransferase n=1 Tax=Rhodovastum atsumiense TaxID=504468 RepID=A0A5M6ILG6_9PROT|nr:penicillin-binding protein 1C [Rhodovastum atsumiense]KAA5609012.1 penicillin-binding protein 1C [Rhodovastum atsumiense]CAH2599070.1 Multimodular transpeptidase-transglycosylase [Rhodovastum atsumiense]